jgi:hypothetical protein
MTYFMNTAVQSPRNGIGAKEIFGDEIMQCPGNSFPQTAM